MRPRHKARSNGLVAILLVGVFFAVPEAVADEPTLEIAEPMPADLSLSLAAAKKNCKLDIEANYSNVAWSNGFSDSGTAAFWIAPLVGLPMNYDGSGGHIGTIYKCHRNNRFGCDEGGYVGATGSFSFAGTNYLGSGARIYIDSEQRGPPNYYTCDGSRKQAAAFDKAKAFASLISGTFAAHANHGGLPVQSSEGRAELFAESTRQFAFETYSYHWTYEGVGNIAAVPVTVHGTGADRDTFT